jgi:tetratricopeptide (TPR) repeat protein
LLTRRRKKPVYRRLAFWVTILLLVIVVAVGWHLFSGTNDPLSPKFDHILFSVNGKSQEIFSGETLTLHPKDRVKILKMSASLFFDLGVRNVKVLKTSTDILFNLGFRLVSEHLDVTALRYKEIAVSALLPNQNIFEHYKFRVEIKYRNQSLGYMILDVRPLPADWLDKANRTINKEQRITILRRAVDMFPKNAGLERGLLREYKSLGHLDKVIEMLEKKAGKKPDKKTLTELFGIYTTTKAADGKISVLKRLINLDPEDLETRLQLAELLEKKGKLGGAAEEYEALVKRMHEKDRLPVYERLGYLHTETGQLKKAISNYLAAANMDKEDANIYYNLSYLYEKTGQKKEAEKYLKKGVALRTEDLEGRIKLAKSLMGKGRRGEAERYLSEVLEEKPDSLKALMLMAKVLAKGGNKERLKEIYEKILSLDPKDETIIYNMGILEYEDGNLKGSLSYLTKYIKLHPKDVAVREILFDIYMRQGDQKTTFRQAQILVDLKPRELDLYDFIFEYLKGQGDYETMIPIMEKGVQANPKQVVIREYLTVAYLKTGKENLAIKQLEGMHRLRPKDMDLLLNLARLQDKRNLREAALKTYKRVLDLSPDHEEASEAYLRLRFKGVQNENTQ